MVGLGLIAFVRWLGSAHGLIAALSKLAAAALAVALLIGLPQSGTAVTTPRASSVTISEPWSAAPVAELRGEGRTIFVDFTAAWCLSCKVHERVPLHSAGVDPSFRAKAWSGSVPAEPTVAPATT